MALSPGDVHNGCAPISAQRPPPQLSPLRQESEDFDFAVLFIDIDL
jgi:hypothetical protein